MQSDSIAAIRFRTFSRGEVGKLCELMSETRASFTRIRSQAMYLTICTEALKSDQLSIVVADCETRLVGFTAAVVDSNAFWRRFLWRHPILGARALASSLLRMPLRDRNDPWNQSSRNIAQMLYIGLPVLIGIKELQPVSIGFCSIA